jgi:hypothetical protein
MTDQTFLLLIVLLVLLTKHVIFDFVLQTAAQVKTKGIYGHPGGLLHAGGHALGTCAAFAVITPPIAVAIGIVVAEFGLHYHIDWLKEKIGVALSLRPDQGPYWWIFGIDQWLHQLTYLGIAAVLIVT